MATDSDASPILDILEQLLEAFNRHDLDTIMSYFAEDCLFDMPRGPDPWGATLAGEGAGAQRAGQPIQWHPRRPLWRGPALGLRTHLWRHGLDAHWYHDRWRSCQRPRL